MTVHRYSGELLAHEESFDKNIRAKYGAPFIDVHRADLMEALLRRAEEIGVKVLLGQAVQSIDFNGPSATTATGNTYTCDLIIAADGIWSRCRECVNKGRDTPLPTGDLAYRIVLAADAISDPDLKALVQDPQVHFWIGPGAHAVGYSLKGGEMYNIVLLCPDNLPTGVSKSAGSVEEMKDLFTGWDPM